MKKIFHILFLLISIQGIAQEYSSEAKTQIDSLNILVNDKSIDDTTMVSAYLALSEWLYPLNPDTVIPLCKKSLMIAERALEKKPTKTVKDVLLKLMSLDYNNIGYIYKKNGNKQEAIKYYNKGLLLQKELGNKKDIANSLTNIGSFYYQQGDIDKTIKLYKEALALFKAVEDKKGEAIVLNNIGSIYKRQGDISRALKYFHKSLAIKKEVGDLNGIATSLNNIGNIYKNQNEYNKALNYYQQSLEIRKKGGDKDGMAYTLANIGTFYQNQDEIEKALEYLHKSLEIRKEINDKEGISSCLSNIGLIYYRLSEIDKAEDFFSKSLAIREEMGDKQGVASCLSSLGEIYLDRGNVFKAKTVGLKSLKLSQSLGFPRDIKSAAKLLTRVYERERKGMEALGMHKLYIQMRDSINNAETHKAAANQLAKYEYDKLRAINVAENEKQKLRKTAEYDKLIAIEKETKEKQKIIMYASVGGVMFLVAFLFFVFNRLKITRKQKDIIETQKEIVELAHKDITDSIAYAKRIQSAILPPVKVVKEHLQDSFILYKPKDVVAGDFYWLESVAPTGDKKEATILFAAADCTGHGVPGAMVSVVCNNALNRSVREHGITDPAKILDKTRTIIIEEFDKSEEDVRDGMDIALCSMEGGILKYAGAHNPLWIIRDGEIIETKANKQPIGKFMYKEPYTTHTFELKKGDTIYIFSDGYVDQFGGEKGKKFKTKAFRELLLSIQDQSMDNQKNTIDKVFEDWRGDLEQIDDVCVIGVRV